MLAAWFAFVHRSVNKSAALLPLLALSLSSPLSSQSRSPELVVETGVTANPAVAFSPDGKWFATGARARLTLWDAVSENQLRTVDGASVGGPGGGYLSISADRKAVIAHDGLSHQTSFWDVASGQPLESLTRFINAVPWKAPPLFYSAVFHPTENVMAAANMSGEVFVVDGADGHPVVALHETDPAAFKPTSTPILLFSPDGNFLVANWGTHARIWRWRAGQLVTDISAVEIHSPNLDRKVDLIGFPGGGQPNQTARIAGLHVFAALCWSADSKQLALVHEDEVSILEAPSFTKKMTISATEQGILQAAIFSPDNRLIVGSSGQSLIVDLTTKATATFPRSAVNYSNPVNAFGQCDPAPCQSPPGTGARSFAFSPDGHTLLMGDTNGLRIIQYPDGADHKVINSALSPVSQIIPLDKRPLLAFGGEWYTRDPLVYWDLGNGSPRFPSNIKNEFGHYFDISADGKRLAFHSDVGVVIWDIDGRREIRHFPSSLPDSMALNQDGNILALSRESQSPLVLCAVSDGLCAPVQLPEKGDRFGLHFTGKGSFLLVKVLTNQMQHFYLLDGHTGRLVRDLSSDPNRRRDCPIRGVEIAEDESVMAVFYDDASRPLGKLGVERVDLATSKSLGFVAEKDAPGIVEGKLSPSGRWIVSSSQGLLRMWDFGTGHEVFHVPGRVHNSTITFDRQERWFVLNTNTLGLLESGNPGGVIEFHSTKDGSLLATVLMLNPYRRDWLAVTPEGFFDGTAAAWDKVLWRFDGNTFDVVPVEVYFRDFFVPGLLASLDHGVTLPQVSAIANLNRTQPSVKIMKVTPEANHSNEVSVVVAVSTVKSKVQRDDQQRYFESGVYDVRLFRGGQLVGQWPARGTIQNERPNAGKNDLERWRRVHRVPLNSSGEGTITFQHIHLRTRAGIKTAEFTAYAFNSDRVKSLTTAPFSYALPTSEKGEVRPSRLSDHDRGRRQRVTLESGVSGL
jgi:WD40 repeat protein